MKFSILTIHPAVADGVFLDGLMKKALEKNYVSKAIIDIRDFSDLPHRRVDDKPYGGGPGMIFRPEPLAGAIQKTRADLPENSRVIVLSAKGKKFTQETAKRLSRYNHLILVCGRYEGIDERVIEHYADEEISVGDYVLMGGEVAAGVVIESVSRYVPGVLGNSESLQEESFNAELPTGEYPQYTRPQSFEGHDVPEVLVGGDHAAIQKWRKTT